MKLEMNKLRKLMLDGKYVKVNKEFVMSNGWFAYDGCHKIYILESEKDLNESMSYGYRIYPIEEIEKTFNESCPLKFISNWRMSKNYVVQFASANWRSVKAPKKDIDAILNNI